MKSLTIPSVYEALDLVMKYYPDNFNEQAKVEIETLFAHCLNGLSTDSEKFLSLLFIKSLKNHVSYSSIDDNIYLKKYEKPQIQLFDLLIKEFPFVRLSQQIVNGTMLNLMHNSEEVTIVDIGIGWGTQVVNLINSTEELYHLKKMHVVGIEPSAEALKKAEKAIMSLNKDTQFEIDFIAINGFVENLDLKSLIQPKGKTIVNASLALHHIQTSEKRFNTLKALNELKPHAFLLTEPNVDHFEPNFYRRFENCYQHFYNIFRVIDKLELDKNTQNAFKMFYGREIEDIIGKNEENRFEKHEPAFRWIEKLKQVGFEVKGGFFRYPNKTVADLKINFHDEGFLGFTHESETILAIIYAI